LRESSLNHLSSDDALDRGRTFVFFGGAGLDGRRPSTARRTALVAVIRRPNALTT
jgi:hypothetical protein